MKILLLHNRYQHSGGEDVVVEQERAMLAGRGHDVRLLAANNDAIQGMIMRLRTATEAFYSLSSKRRLEAELQNFEPDVVHAHNLFPVLSPSVLYACAQRNVPVVQTLHNYRLLCPAAALFRDGSVCEQCLGRRFAWPGVWHGCYRGSRMGTLVVATLLAFHRVLGTSDKTVARYITLSEFARRKLGKGGLPAFKLLVKPNFLDPDPGPGQGEGGYVLFVGRLSPEKGIEILLRAWRLGGAGLPLKIVGSGPMEEQCREAAHQNQLIEYLGSKPPDEVYALMGSAQALVVPSLCYEGHPRTIVEAFSKATPVVASRLGSVEELVEHGRTGLHFTAGDSDALAERINWLAAHDAEAKRMRIEARREYETKYTADRNYLLLIEAYQQAIAEYPRPAAESRKQKSRSGWHAAHNQPSYPGSAGLKHARANVLGVGISAIDMNEAIRLSDELLQGTDSGYVCVTGVHGVMEAQSNPAFGRILNRSFLTTPDGMPMVWVGKLQGFDIMRRVYGPDYMLELCRLSVSRGYRHFLYGGNDGVAQRLALELTARFPGLNIVGTYTPPFRPLNPTEEKNLLASVDRLRPDVFWVGLSTPKQEVFMAQYIDRLNVKLMVGVGAAFDIHTGGIADAPAWMKNCGLQWLHRLAQEPSRLWRRYLVNNPRFAWNIGLQLTGLRRFDQQ